METQDPIRSLSSSSLPERAAAGRDLSQVGQPELIPRLLELAVTDRSPAVRLTMAMAAADILSRYRVGARRDALDLGTRRGFYALFKGLDPGINSGLFSVLACLDIPEALPSLGVGLRDPRETVRVGAAVGLLRLCMSASVAEDQELERYVVSMLSDRRLKPDALIEVARICAAAGYGSARRPLEVLGLSGVQGDVVAAALVVLTDQRRPLRGAWRADGRDAGEVNPETSFEPAFWVLGPAAVLEAGPAEWRARPLALATDARRLYIRRVGEPDPGHAFQSEGRTFYPAREAELLEVLERVTAPEELIWGSAAPRSEADALAADALAEVLQDSGPLSRARALLLGRAGRPAAALAALEEAVDQKRTPADTWFFLGEALAAADRLEEARAAWEGYLKREKRKRAPYVERVTARLG